MKKRFSEEQIVSMLREAEVGELPAKELCRKHGISEQTFYRWKTKYGGMEVSDARRLKTLESENAKLKRMNRGRALGRGVSKCKFVRPKLNHEPAVVPKATTQTTLASLFGGR